MKYPKEEEYVPRVRRLSIELDQNLFDRLRVQIPYGFKHKLFQQIAEDLCAKLEKVPQGHKLTFIGAYLDKKIVLEDFTQMDNLVISRSDDD